MNLIHEYLEENRDFTNYQDLKEHCRLKAPQNFNFAYDIVDRYAKETPNKRALVWCDDNDEERIFTFADIASESKKLHTF